MLAKLLIDSLIESELPEIKRYGSYWLDPSGVFYEVHDHAPFAEKMLKAEPSSLHGNDNWAVEKLGRMGWIRIVSSAEPNKTLFLSQGDYGIKTKMTPSQRISLEDAVFEQGFAVIDANTHQNEKLFD